MLEQNGHSDFSDDDDDTVPDNFFVILADVFDSQNCDRSSYVYLKTPNSKSLLIPLSSVGRAKSLQPAIAGGHYRSPTNSRQATAVRAAAKRDSAGRRPWLTPFA